MSYQKKIRTDFFSHELDWAKIKSLTLSHELDWAKIISLTLTLSRQSPSLRHPHPHPHPHIINP